MQSYVTLACAMLSAREVILAEVRLVSVMLMNSWIKIRKSASLISVPVPDPDVPSIALVIIVVTSTTACNKSQLCFLYLESYRLG